MKISYFTFGQSHAHRFGNVTLDKDVVVRIEDPDPRARMFELFGDVWSFQYDQPPDMSHFPRGIYDINEHKFVEEEAKDAV